MFVSKLDDIAWALNLRGIDIPFNPVFFCYMIIFDNGTSNHHVNLYINAEKVCDEEV